MLPAQAKILLLQKVGFLSGKRTLSVRFLKDVLVVIALSQKRILLKVLMFLKS